MSLKHSFITLAMWFLICSSTFGDVCVTEMVQRFDGPDPNDEIWVIACSGVCTCFKVGDGSIKWCDCDSENMTSPTCCHGAVPISGSTPLAAGNCHTCPNEDGHCSLIYGYPPITAYALCLPTP